MNDQAEKIESRLLIWSENFHKKYPKQKNILESDQ